MKHRDWHYFCGHRNMGQRTVKSRCSLLCAPWTHMTDPKVAVTQQPTHPTGLSCTWCQAPLGRTLDRFSCPVSSMSHCQKVLWDTWQSIHTGRKGHSSLSKKIKGKMCLDLQKCISWYPCRKISLAMEASFSRTCSSSLTVINKLKELKKIFRERLRSS